ncbi:hypothetical protein ES332_A09G082900v1 [Gossypium tomentosum]|uniref:Uncharacterized protein n=1 Tax=Gossypium tomentosum TaxID=34277 RepID=A0A5D2P2R2_GOSTO|nr:hypothetical protein ES332_A09G082900v1 [Gossypium tomentosum]
MKTRGVHWSDIHARERGSDGRNRRLGQRSTRETLLFRCKEAVIGRRVC